MIGSNESSKQAYEAARVDLAEMNLGSVAACRGPSGRPVMGPRGRADSAPASGGEATGLRLRITATEDDLFVLNQLLSKLRDLL